MVINCTIITSPPIPVAITKVNIMTDMTLIPTGGIGGDAGVMMNGKLSAQQTAYIERAGAKLLAALSLMEGKNDISAKSG